MNSQQLHSYDHYLVQFSGGKDSTACVLWLLQLALTVKTQDPHNIKTDMITEILKQDNSRQQLLDRIRKEAPYFPETLRIKEQEHVIHVTYSACWVRILHPEQNVWHRVLLIESMSCYSDDPHWLLQWQLCIQLQKSAYNILVCWKFGSTEEIDPLQMSEVERLTIINNPNRTTKPDERQKRLE